MGIEKTKKILDTIKRFDMKGFRPRKSYIREMIRYGILPDSFDLKNDPVNVYELDKKYFQSQWYYPPEEEPKRYDNPYPMDEKWHTDPPLVITAPKKKKKNDPEILFSLPGIMPQVSCEGNFLLKNFLLKISYTNC